MVNSVWTYLSSLFFGCRYLGRRLRSTGARGRAEAISPVTFTLERLSPVVHWSLSTREKDDESKNVRILKNWHCPGIPCIFPGMPGLWNTGILWNTAPWQTFIAFHHGSTARSKAAAWRLTIASWLNFFQSSGRMMGPFSPFKLPYINHYNYDCNYINQWLNLYCCLL